MLAEVFAEMGLIASLDDPVRRYAPSFAGPVNTFGDGAEITLRQLMSHTASLPDSLPGGVDWELNVTTADVFAAIAGLPMTVPLGSLPSYSNLGIALLGHVLAEFIAPPSERGDIAALLGKYILTPLGLAAETGYTLTPFAVANLVPAYDGNGDRVPKFDLRVAAYGTVDETNATLGMARLHGGALDDSLARVSNDLFDLDGKFSGWNQN
jgi:CubicO group peptidase (beta-lactamase class C family)